MTFLTILVVTEIRCSFIRWKFLANNFALSEAEDNTSGPLIRGGITDLPLLRTLIAIHQKSWELSTFGKVGHFCFISISKFSSFKNPFAAVTSLSGLYFRFRKFILLVITKKVIYVNYGSSRSSWKQWRWVRLGLIFLMRDTPIPTRNHSQNSLAVAEAQSLKISSHGTSLKWSWRPSQSAQE